MNNVSKLSCVNVAPFMQKLPYISPRFGVLLNRVNPYLTWLPIAWKVGDTFGSYLSESIPDLNEGAYDISYLVFAGTFPPVGSSVQSGASGSTIVGNAGDPNQKTGPAGFGTSGFVPLTGALAYRIDFENPSNFSAPAQHGIFSAQTTPT